MKKILLKVTGAACAIFTLQSGHTEALPQRKVWAAGLTFKKHIKDAGESVDKKYGPPMFIKAAQTLVFSESRQKVSIPQDAVVYAELEKLETGLSGKVREKYAEFPHLLDYEAELGIYFNRTITRSELNSSQSLKNAVSYFTSNDLTVRSFQILGDKQKNIYDYWSAGKGFKNFLPYSTPKAVLDFPLEQWHALSIRLWVNGELRQNESMADMAYTPRKVLETLMRYTGQDRIPAGTIFIGGTPTGTAFKISAFKRLLGNFLFFARMFKFKIAVDGMIDDPKFLKAGDEVIVEIPNLGQNRVLIVD